MDANTQIPALYFEDFRVGQVYRTGGITLTEGQIIDFAHRYDPQPFHVNALAAAESPYGGLIASGFQTLALSFRLFIDLGVIQASGMGGPGIDELKWLMPVRAGDTLHCLTEVIEVRPSSTRIDRGYVKWRFQTLNQHSDVVMSYLLPGIVATRPRTVAKA